MPGRSYFSFLKVVLILLVLISIYTIYYKSAKVSTDVKQLVNTNLDRWDVSRGKQPESRENQKGIPHLAFTLCGDRFIEAWNMLKSAILFTNTFLVVHIFTETEHQLELRQQLESLPPDVRKNLQINIYNVSFPADVNCKKCKHFEWKTLFRPCSSQRLFLADLLTNVDSVIYADIDMLFLAPVEELWSFFTKFNSTQIVAAVPVYDLPIPIVGPKGINAGLLLLNLTRLRNNTWASSVMETMIGFKQGLVQRTDDQDICNRYLNTNPEQAYLLPCEWNYRRRLKCRCKNATTAGAAILHGTTFSFISNKYPPMKAVFSAFRQFDIGTHSIQADLLENIKTNLDAVEPFECSNDINVYTQRIVQFIRRGYT